MGCGKGACIVRCDWGISLYRLTVVWLNITSFLPPSDIHHSLPLKLHKLARNQNMP